MPCVWLYPFLSPRIAATAASLIASGTAKSGCPIERLIGFFILAARSNTLRMPELSNFAVRSANQGCDVIEMKNPETENGRWPPSFQRPGGGFETCPHQPDELARETYHQKPRWTTDHQSTTDRSSLPVSASHATREVSRTRLRFAATTGFTGRETSSSASA